MSYQKKLDKVSVCIIYTDHIPGDHRFDTLEEASGVAREMHRENPQQWHEVYRELPEDDYWPKGFRYGAEQWKPWDCADCKKPLTEETHFAHTGECKYAEAE